MSVVGLPVVRALRGAFGRSRRFDVGVRAKRAGACVDAQCVRRGGRGPLGHDLLPRSACTPQQLIHHARLNGHVTIPSDHNHIPYRAFMQCTALSSITLPASVTQIQYEAFRGSGLKYIDLSELAQDLMGRLQRLHAAERPDQTTVDVHYVGSSAFMSSTVEEIDMYSTGVTSIPYYFCVSAARSSR